MTDYWNRTLLNRTSRRRILLGTAGGVLGAAFLAACGGSDKSATKGKDAVAPYVDTSKRAVKGGILQSYQTQVPLNFDPLTGTSYTTSHAVHAYSRPLGWKVGTVFDRPDGTVEPDAMTSWEISPDGLQVTMKLRPNMRLDSRAPTNGRALTVEDVKYSFDKFAALSPTNGNLMYKSNPFAPIESLSIVDNSTMVLKLQHPDGSILKMLAWGFFLNIVPVEAEGKFDIKQDMRGTGPWMLTKSESSVGWSYRRNPNWWRANDLPYLDGIDYALVPETVTQLAQFKAKNLWNLMPSAENVISLKRENPDSELHAISPLIGNTSSRVMVTSKIPTSPLMDVRARQAISMLIDRDTMLEVFGNISAFEKEGIEMESAWHGMASCSWPGIWLDPKAGKLGDASKYFQHNPDEATKLLKAAGQYGSTVDYGVQTDAPSDQLKLVEVVAQMLEENGHLKINRLTGEYTPWYQPKYYRSKNQFDGLASYMVLSGFPDYSMVMWGHTAPGARNDYITSWDNVPGLQDIMVKHLQERDEQKRTALAHDYQKLLAQYLPFIPYSAPFGTTTFNFNWPWLANYNVYKTWGIYTIGHDETTHWWYDKSKDTRSS